MSSKKEYDLIEDLINNFEAHANGSHPPIGFKKVPKKHPSPNKIKDI